MAANSVVPLSEEERLRLAALWSYTGRTGTCERPSRDRVLRIEADHPASSDSSSRSTSTRMPRHSVTPEEGGREARGVGARGEGGGALVPRNLADPVRYSRRDFFRHPACRPGEQRPAMAVPPWPFPTHASTLTALALPGGAPSDQSARSITQHSLTSTKNNVLALAQAAQVAPDALGEAVVHLGRQ
eukprot:scaffold4297_cov103-Isochrysis_galbana.AAC.3